MRTSMPPGPRPPTVILSDTERETLDRWSRRPTSAQALAERARIVLGAATGQSNTALAAPLQLTRPTIIKWRGRFVAQRLDGLLDEPRPGAPWQISDAAIEDVLTQTLETAITSPSVVESSRRRFCAGCTMNIAWRARRRDRRQ